MTINDRLKDWAQWQQEGGPIIRGYKNPLADLVTDDYIKTQSKKHTISSTDDELWQTEKMLCALRGRDKMLYNFTATYYAVGCNIIETASRLNSSRPTVDKHVTAGKNWLEGMLFAYENPTN